MGFGFQVWAQREHACDLLALENAELDSVEVVIGMSGSYLVLLPYVLALDSFAGVNCAHILLFSDVRA